MFFGQSELPIGIPSTTVQVGGRVDLAGYKRMINPVFHQIISLCVKAANKYILIIVHYCFTSVCNFHLYGVLLP
jgi:hypothetical protein